MRSGVLPPDWPAYGGLTLLCFALYLPGLATIPPVDRDEPRFAQATKQMLQSGDFIRPRFQMEDRFNKPIGIYWLQAVAVGLTRQQDRPAIWAYRLPSVLGACAAVWLTYWIGCQLFNRSVAVLAAAFLASSALLVVEAHLATTDAVLLACVVAAQACLALLYAAAQHGSSGLARHAAGFWLALGFGILIKGPIVPLVSGLTVGTLAVLDWRASTRMLAGLRVAWGVPLLAAVVLPWMIAVGLETNSAFYATWIGDVLPKASSGLEGHGAPPGAYVVLLAATFWPASFAIGLGIAYGLRRRERYAERFCLAWLIPTWIFFEVMPTKLPHYVLPTYPALALLVACAVFDPPRSPWLTWRSGLVRTLFVLWGLLTLTAGAMIVIAAIFLGDGLDFQVATAAVAAAVIGILCVRLCWTGRLERAAWVAVVGSVAFFAPTLQWVVPNLKMVWLSPAAAAAVARATGVTGSRPLVAVGYDEPSLIFLVGTNVASVESQGAVAFLEAQHGGLALVSDAQRPAFTQAASDMGVKVRELWSADGINYTKGKRSPLHLFERLSAMDSVP